eukprot:6076014-Pleurochrysis_carterae.AAC.1
MAALNGPIQGYLHVAGAFLFDGRKLYTVILLRFQEQSPVSRPATSARARGDLILLALARQP